MDQIFHGYTGEYTILARLKYKDWVDEMPETGIYTFREDCSFSGKGTYFDSIWIYK